MRRPITYLASLYRGPKSIEDQLPFTASTLTIRPLTQLAKDEIERAGVKAITDRVNDVFCGQMVE